MRTPPDLRALPIAAVAVDAGGAVLDANRAAEVLLNRPNLIGRPLDLPETVEPATGPAHGGGRIVLLHDRADQRERERLAQERYDTLAALSDRFLESAVELDDHSHVLERRVADRTADLREANRKLNEANAHLLSANVDAVFMLAVASEAKDADTGRHVRRLERSAALLATALGLPPDEAAAVGTAAVLHDVGKLHVPDAILAKPGPLDPDEIAVMRTHTLSGERILADTPFFRRARAVARAHHENFDGSGYPDGLAGEAIPLDARIVHLADVYDALTHPRVYKGAWPIDRARAEVRAAAGKMFDPQVVRAFESLAASGELDAD